MTGEETERGVGIERGVVIVTEGARETTDREIMIGTGEAIVTIVGDKRGQCKRKTLTSSRGVRSSVFERRILKRLIF